MTKKQNFGLTCTILLLIAAPATAAFDGIQQPLLPGSPLVMIPGFEDIPTDQWVYSDLRRLQDRKRAGEYPDRSGSFRAYTRGEFATHIAQELAMLDGEFDSQAQQDRELLSALHRLVQEFEPELLRKGVALFAVKVRISTLAQSVVAGRISGPFKDVPENHWAYESVEKLRRVGIIVGYPNNTFTIDNP